MLSSRPLRKGGEVKTRWNVYIPVEIASAVEQLFTNPVTGKVLYAGRSQIVTALLREWLLTQGTPANHPNKEPNQ